MFLTKHGSVGTGTQTEQHRTTSGSYSTTSSRRKHPNRYEPDDEGAYALFLIVALIHIALLLARAAEFIKWPWIIILIPEILMGLAIIALMTAGFYIVLRERRRRRKSDGK